MPATPIATIFIPTYNRPKVLAETLEHLCRLDRIDDIEVLVLDDASEPDITGPLAERFGRFTFLRSDVNRGQSHGRNVLIGQARGELLFGLDDDSWYLRPDAIARALEVFDQHPSAGLLSFRIRWADGRAMPEQPAAIRPVRTFIACGYAIRKNVAQTVGGFLAPLRRQGEEQELSLRILDAGYDILQVDDIDVYHLETDEGRDHQIHHALAMRNELLTIALRYPLRSGLIAGPRALASHAVFCWRQKWFRAYRGGLTGFIGRSGWALRNRAPVSRATLARYRQLGREARKPRTCSPSEAQPPEASEHSASASRTSFSN